LLTCKDFLAELSEYLDEATRDDMKAKLEKHLQECPNCFVVCNTTKKTISVYKGMKLQQIPEETHQRLMAALERKLAAVKN
jgi:anti-sigma factor RsiW